MAGGRTPASSRPTSGARSRSDPLPLYPASKAAAEQLVRAAAADLHTVIVRPRFIWGAGDTSLLPQLLSAVSQGKFRWISGGHYKTSTCHVRNCVEGMLRAAERGGRGETYFLTDGPPVELRQFLRELISTQGFDAGARSIPARGWPVRWPARRRGARAHARLSLAPAGHAR